ncbi:hypothetical protein ACIQXD_05120 [Streptomyces uncialis]|uniref:hypothetical protein n=1 Tax=Streptomyces uncialis TaxID=1048205 RepID=UPI00380F4FA7
MARLQILELPEGTGDDRPPFILVIDEFPAQKYLVGPGIPEPVDWFDGIAEKIGARAVLVFADTIEIPANEVPLGDDGHPLRFAVEGNFTKFREQVEAEVLAAQQKLTTALRRNGDASSTGSEPELPTWVYDLLAAVGENEDMHAMGASCLKAALDVMPADVLSATRLRSKIVRLGRRLEATRSGAGHCGTEPT